MAAESQPLRERSVPSLHEAVEVAFADGSAIRDLRPIYRMLREHAPVFRSDYLEQWLVTTFDLVESVLLQPARFSSYGADAIFVSRLGADAQAFPTIVHHFAQRGLVKSDAPEHTRLRRAVRKPFGAHAVGRLSERIQERVDALLDTSGDRFDVKSDFGRPLTVSVISDLLGVPDAHRRDLPAWSDAFIGFFGTPVPTVETAAALEAALVEWRALLMDLMRERQASPQDDLLSHIALGVEAGELSLEEALVTSVHLMVGGHETTASAIASTMFLLLTHPEAMATARRSPELIPSAIEEAIRLESPVARGRRIATEDCELGGRAIKAGDVVMPVFASANRDAARFDRPDEFDPERGVVGLHHHGFGRGTHFCLGAPLARLEARIAVTTLLGRYPDIRLAEDFDPRWQMSLSSRSLETLPIWVR
jgi:cytochrome P450